MLPVIIIIIVICINSYLYHLTLIGCLYPGLLINIYILLVQSSTLSKMDQEIEPF